MIALSVGAGLTGLGLSFIIPFRMPLDFAGNTIWKGKNDTGKVALTFDDGPDPRFTPRILDILDTTGAKATFFLLGRNIASYPGLVEETALRGHELGIHSWNHLKTLSFRPSLWEGEILRTRDLLERRIGKSISLFRPPHGIRTPVFLDWLKKRGFRTVFWTIMPFDYLNPGEKVIKLAVSSRINGGSIIVLHDGNGMREQTVRVLPDIMSIIYERGLKPVTLSSLIS